MQRTTQYLHPTKNGYKLVTRRVGNRAKKRTPGVMERLVAPWLLLFTMSITAGGFIYRDIIATPVVEAQEVMEVAQDARAGQPEPTPAPEPLTEKEQVIAYIYKVFGDDGELMVKIAECESNLVPDRIGDTHIMGMLDGEMIGDSIGLFQIRTGDAGVYDSKPWNRAEANGMTVEEFRTAMKDPYKNIDYAKQILDRQGLNAWFNCANKVQSK